MTPVLATRDLSFTYGREHDEVISDLTIDIAPAAVTALSGPSGSGKSTLLYLLALMLRPTRGAILWDGVDVSSLADSERSAIRASEVGFVFQDALLDPARTVLDNICDSGLFAGMTRREAELRARPLMERFGIDHRANHRPGEVSGGQAQRVALCRALLTGPRVIFADEPTGNLDPDSADIVWQALLAHARNGATVVLSTHDPALVGESDAVVRLLARTDIGAAP